LSSNIGLIECTDGGEFPIAIGFFNARTANGTYCRVEFERCCCIEISKDFEEVTTSKSFASGEK